jgi:predicted adenine nucleotide alpha hydrolase (AANH) superfamily ATPase
VRGWLVPSAGQKIPVQPGWKLPQQKNTLAENKFLQAGKGAENTNEKSRQCFMCEDNPVLFKSWKND